mmetsp:Transcript_56435/g.132172  ORF Transcript_56435/g.132172 Transcript_56435/m.132172 type:complete len:223 (+) Transcript_56435:316-984(+)
MGDRQVSFHPCGARVAGGRRPRSALVFVGPRVLGSHGHCCLRLLALVVRVAAPVPPRPAKHHVRSVVSRADQLDRGDWADHRRVLLCVSDAVSQVGQLVCFGVGVAVQRECVHRVPGRLFSLQRGRVCHRRLCFRPEAAAHARPGCVCHRWLDGVGVAVSPSAIQKESGRNDQGGFEHVSGGLGRHCLEPERARGHAQDRESAGVRQDPSAPRRTRNANHPP